MLNKHQNVHYLHQCIPTPHHSHLRTPAQSESLNRRTRCKSIHALTPSLLRPMTPKTQRHAPSFAPQTDRLSSFSQQKDAGLIRNLFMDEQAVLRKLQMETQSLEKEKQSVIATNKEEYQRIMEKLMEMRKLCNKRRQDIESLRNELRELETNKMYMKVRDFSSSRQTQRPSASRPGRGEMTSTQRIRNRNNPHAPFASNPMRPHYSIINLNF